MKKATVFGSFAVDLTGFASHLPEPGETVKGSSFKMGPGGKGFNQAVAARKAGCPVTMVTRLGRDNFSSVATDTLKELGMPLDYIFYDNNASTAVALITVDDNNAQNQIMIIPGALDNFTNQEIEKVEPLIAESEYVLLQLEVNQHANELVADIAMKHGTKVILNSAPYCALSNVFLSKCYMITPNEVEAEGLTGIKINNEESAGFAADIMHRKGIKNVLITLGARGVYISTDKINELMPAFEVSAVDTTGAGDAFNGGLLCGLSEGMEICTAVRFGQATAALSVQKFGTAPSMPSRKEIDSFLEEHIL